MKLLLELLKLPAFKKRDPNWQALQAKRQSGAMGKHRDKKKELKMGKQKYKASGYSEE